VTVAVAGFQAITIAFPDSLDPQHARALANTFEARLRAREAELAAQCADWRSSAELRREWDRHVVAVWHVLQARVVEAAGASCVAWRALH
jgi:hypothetical protein